MANNKKETTEKGAELSVEEQLALALETINKQSEDINLLKSAVTAKAGETGTELKKPTLIIEDGKQPFKGMVR